jgi:hypothetical protein
VYASLRAAGKKADLSLIVADEPAVAGGCFTKNVMCAAPVLYCKDVLARKKKVKAVRSVHRLEACSACISPVHATQLFVVQDTCRTACRGVLVSVDSSAQAATRNAVIEPESVWHVVLQLPYTCKRNICRNLLRHQARELCKHAHNAVWRQKPTPACAATAVLIFRS